MLKLQYAKGVKKEMPVMASTASGDTCRNTSTRQPTSSVAHISASGLVCGLPSVADDNLSGSIPPSGRGCHGDVKRML
ncbi:hypothetical protein CDAR_315811 [Caerostris darwini]|uniref:Uncharacterized protein n=1 Tax=Caerostris darwini TaxID=1538125 RepID=A0AAV4UWQ2_9ARAC|nr:hypothetical protein CDAR_315811 [Caerostris darwini]